MLANFPGLQMLERHLEVGAFRIRERPMRLAQAHRPAHLVGHEPHGRLVRVHERRVHIEPHVGISWHRRVEDRLWRQAEIFERGRLDRAAPTAPSLVSGRSGSRHGHSVFGPKVVGEELLVDHRAVPARDAGHAMAIEPEERVDDTRRRRRTGSSRPRTCRAIRVGATTDDPSAAGPRSEASATSRGCNRRERSAFRRDRYFRSMSPASATIGSDSHP